MPLKRGLERESCDFCFRRKIKCDRSSRAEKGCPTCSQCDLRQTPCTFECDDVRLQRRRKTSPKGGLPGAGRGTHTSIGATAEQEIGRDGWICASNLALGAGNNNLLPFYDGITISGQAPPGVSVGIGIQSPAASSSLPAFPEFEFDLSPEGVSFLDSIFLQSHDMVEPIVVPGNTPAQPLRLENELQNNQSTAPNPYCVPDIPLETLNTAIDAYFNFASLALPVLSKEGFMEDYRCYGSSPALVFAVACQGCPFIQATDKWAIQQRLASHFRETFLQARSAASTQHVVRLDDLEAFALMVDFEYESWGDINMPLQSELRNLLLTHDSLVVMTLQYRIEARFTTASGMLATLSRAAERQTLLFWYVYGQDAFRCLDSRAASRILDQDVDLSRQLDGHGSQSYFDAILGLAAIARKMARTLCGPLSRRKGVKHQDVDDLYRQLGDWHTAVCPPAFQVAPHSRVNSPQERTVYLYTEGNEFPPLHRAVVALLELNLFMQLEACVSRYGIEGRVSLMGQMVDMRVKYETLRAASRIVEVARSIEKFTASQQTSGSSVMYGMADLAPGIIRNICAGASTWISLRAREGLHSPVHEGAYLALRRTDYVLEDESITGLLQERAESWMVSITAARDVAATAISHRDTEPLIERLDQQLGTLKELSKRHGI
ncbi:putative fungal transcriptional regulatory [Rosellinia necatrix]|uniref:Putative fungal transcriptional regulatory n=1 Tax=Rosellinia necatrix TaxID=77044 RepID=A0A1S8A9N5_ROSNE|nr:putative fungal transcriptional regulatory [Rosellinia necatrix]